MCPKPSYNINTFSYFGINSNECHFHFNGKEGDDEVKGEGNSLDFGARIYDARLGRFLSVDPDYQKYPSQNSYCFAANSPIRFVDSEGKGVFDKIAAFFNRSYNLMTKGDFKTNYEIQKETYKNALNARYDYYYMVLEADPTKANKDYLLSIPFIVDKFDAPNPDKDKLTEWKPDPFQSIEDYLNSPSANRGKAIDKVVANIIYGVINSPYILLTGESLGGETQTPNEKMGAFIDVAPGKLLGALKGANVLKLKGGYEDFAKQTKNQFKGSSTDIFEQRTKAFKANEANSSSIKSAENADKVRGAGTETKKEAEKP